MGFFNRKKKENTNTNYHQPVIPTGLGVKPVVEDGRTVSYGVYQLQTDELLLSCETRERALEAIIELNKLIDWDVERDVHYEIIIKPDNYEIFGKMNLIIEEYAVFDSTEGNNFNGYKEEGENKDNNNKRGESSSQQHFAQKPIYDDNKRTDGKIFISYQVVQKNGNYKRVNGEQIVEDGLAIHREQGETWMIDHIASYNMLFEIETYTLARKCALAIADIVDWSDPFVIDLVAETKEFQVYLRDVQDAVIKERSMPNIPQRLLYKIEFFSLRKENADFKRFSDAIDSLTNLVGLDTIKQEVLDMIYTIAGKERNKGKIKEGKSNHHMVFMGPAGTGKNEVARIMSEIFASLGYIEKGHLVEVSRVDLVGDSVGSTAPKVMEVVERAIGGTLFIDEAYALAGDSQDFGGEAISTLIKQMEDRNGQFIVILAGYPADMNKLLDMNEGFRSRIKSYFHFNDYTPQQVATIIENRLRQRGYELNQNTLLAIDKALKNFEKQGKIVGNARTGRNIAEGISDEVNIRLGKDRKQEVTDTTLITPEDVENATNPKTKNKKREELEAIKEKAIEKLYRLIGMNDLKKQTQRILNTLVIDNMRYQNGLSRTKNRMHMNFSGPPGTGKTTVARIMGEFLKGAGLLSNGHFVEVSRSDLVAGYVGQTAMKVKDVIAKAKGGILFIDEAYALASGDDFGKEALDTLIKEMEDQADDLVVILAGYKGQMEELMKLNEGLRSRVPYHFDFPHYSDSELFEIALLQLKYTYGFEADTEAKQALREYIDGECQVKGYVEGDGRWIRNLCEEIKDNQAARLSPILSIRQVTVAELKEIKKEDMPNVYAS